MTYSIGLRAPSRAELIAGWAQHVAAQLEDDDRYADPDLALQDNPGEISAEALVRMRTMVTERLLAAQSFAQWFGEYCTAPKDHEIDWSPEQPMALPELRAAIAQSRPLLRNPASRFSFVNLDAGSLTLFVDGRSYSCTGVAAELAKRVCASSEFVIDPNLLNSDTAVRVLMQMLADGSVDLGRPSSSPPQPGGSAAGA
jgi:50S ribosomal protein L16 3-hydroxylase